MTFPTYIERICYECRSALGKTHWIAKTPDGDVRVHKVCKSIVEDRFRKLTAQISDKQTRSYE